MSTELDSLNVNRIIRDKDSVINGRIATQPDSNVYFDDCIFVDELQIGNTNDNIFRRVFFVNCKFTEQLIYNNAIGISEVQFENCIFEKNVIMKYLNGGLTIKGNCLIKGFFSFSSTGGQSLLIKDLDIEGKISLTGKISGGVIMENINSGIKRNQSILILDKLDITSVILKQAFLKDVFIKNNTIIHHEILLDGVTSSSLELNHMTIGLLLTLNASQFENISIDNIKTDHRHIIINNCIVTNTLGIALSMIEDLKISKANLSTLRIWGNLNKGSFVSIEKSEISKLKIDEIFNEGNISFRQIKMVNESFLSLRSSNLGKTDFILCDFTKVKIEFENSKLTELFLSETDFPKKVYIDQEVNFPQAQLLFGQLQTAFQRQGDSVRMMEYQAREIEAHYQTITWLSQDFFKKINLFLNKISNNFGRYWTYGILFSFSIGAIFFYFLVISTKEFQFGFPIKFDQKILMAYLKFMNPLRFFELDSIFRANNVDSNITLNGWSYLWDFLGRVFIAYGFYQTIQAFRRFGKK